MSATGKTKFDGKSLLSSETKKVRADFSTNVRISIKNIFVT